MYHLSLKRDQHPFANSLSFAAPSFTHVFDDVLSEFGARYEVEETEDGSFCVSLPLPGYKKSEVTVEVANGTLRVEAKNAKQSFARSLDLLETIDAEQIGATLEDGVLTLVLKRSEAAKPRRIEVK